MFFFVPAGTNSKRNVSASKSHLKLLAFFGVSFKAVGGRRTAEHDRCDEVGLFRSPVLHSGETAEASVPGRHHCFSPLRLWSIRVSVDYGSIVSTLNMFGVLIYIISLYFLLHLREELSLGFEQINSSFGCSQLVWAWIKNQGDQTSPHVTHPQLLFATFHPKMTQHVCLGNIFKVFATWQTPLQTDIVSYPTFRPPS